MRINVDLLQVQQLKGLSVLHPDVRAVVDAVDVVHQVHQLLVVLLIIVVGNYRDSVVQLVSKRIHSIIHDYQVFQLSVLDDPEVFDVDSFWGLDAVVSIEAVIDELLGLLLLLHHIVSLLVVAR